MSQNVARAPAHRALAFALAAVVGATAIAVVPTTPRAEAQSTASPTGNGAGSGAGTLADAKAHMDRGQGLFLDKKFAEAAAEFHEAYAIKPFSTFLFNEAVCHEKLAEYDAAVALFQRYVDTDPNAPDRAQVVERIEKIKNRNQAVLDAGADGDAGESAEGGAEAGVVAPIAQPQAATIDEMRSIVLIESLPDGAPVEIWSRTDPAAAKFAIGGDNKGWSKVVTGTTPLTQSLPLGTYHVVLPRFRDYRATDTDVTVAAATISQFKANLAQGAFFGVMKIRSYAEGNEIRGAHVFVEKAGDKAFVDRGTTPYEESLENGSYAVRVEQPGFTPLEKKLELEHGKIDEQRFELQRSNDGLVRVDVLGADEAEVIVDDKSWGKVEHGRALNVPVPAGPHRVKLKADDRKTYTTDIDVPKGQMVPVHAELRPTMPRGSAWTTAIAATVFIGGGIYLGVVSSGLKTDLESAQKSGRLDQEDSRIKKGQYYAIGADVCLGLGTLFALIATYNFVRDPLPDSIGHNEKARDLDALPPAPRPSARLMPYGGPNAAGFALVGEF